MMVQSYLQSLTNIHNNIIYTVPVAQWSSAVVLWIKVSDKFKCKRKEAADDSSLVTLTD